MCSAVCQPSEVFPFQRLNCSICQTNAKILLSAPITQIIQVFVSRSILAFVCFNIFSISGSTSTYYDCPLCTCVLNDCRTYLVLPMGYPQIIATRPSSEVCGEIALPLKLINAGLGPTFAAPFLCPIVV